MRKLQVAQEGGKEPPVNIGAAVALAHQVVSRLEGLSSFAAAKIGGRQLRDTCAV
ncbi:MAG: hypothetical protein MJA84_08830 [Firmicutes bacterium]|nr:hypothetical protein [Bacillota bacterium]